jgi:hypothetical protein
MLPPATGQPLPQKSAPLLLRNPLAGRIAAYSGFDSVQSLQVRVAHLLLLLFGAMPEPHFNSQFFVRTEVLLKDGRRN